MPPPDPLPLPVAAARRFHRAAVGLDTPHAGVDAALRHHGFVQLDPINVCGRMHDLILRNRVAGYREGDLLRHTHGPDTAPLPPAARRAFEHYLPEAGILVVFPLAAWPHLPASFERRRAHHSSWSGRLSAAEERAAGHILAELAARGPLSADDIVHEGRARTAWGSRARLVKTVLDKLFLHGRVLIAARRNFRRVFDLPDRVLPADLLAAPRPAAATTARWLVENKLRQRRLVLLKRDELPLVEDLVQPVRVDGAPLLHCLRSDLPLLDTVRSAPAAEPRLLAPLDPLIYDRRVTAALWDFEYTWEVYTPAARRVRGYYALPVLAGDALVGHVDPLADRPARRLRVVGRSLRRGHAAAPAVAKLARFLGLRAR